MTTTLLLGGARSGKSGLAEQMAHASGQPVTVLVTATATDDEMAARIAHHRQQRPSHWQTVEAREVLAEGIEQHCVAGQTVIVDCLTLWLSHALFTADAQWAEAPAPVLPAAWQAARSRLLDAVTQASGTLLLISNEVGLGVVPLGAGTRAFVDEAGRLHQALARVCDNVVWVAAGLPLAMKGQVPACG
ncbi:bifunctional adenosylcobinamide kinase/adenosylcobinamide-phosphate guanylyltransferase [Silvimonas amylolytica]|uniref:Bifunctional adenosylcobalamin biosynthesis protein n=1 Tax=Silvimonas amylolytica TaxID=449663 RepID=A0ABQ2PN09_9NEIS|nr:bifunctional adenosylcobinamide kinase/adenosylcobinamide-phosphate guanylyltransferase [Silvimonas amylolytica]GGP26586.1 adenosylcobinamide kinase/adenosylcobinamide phosphate guanyltransferase [Silvimonas amylolytica]